MSRRLVCVALGLLALTGCGRAGGQPTHASAAPQVPWMAVYGEVAGWGEMWAQDEAARLNSLQEGCEGALQADAPACSELPGWSPVSNGS